MNILVIEDNESVCSMLSMFFLKENFQATFIHNGTEGFNHLIKNKYDMIILDWMLPGLDGITICRKIRENDSSTPIIMLTAKDTESDQVLGLEMGADDFVSKPFSPLALMARIKAVFRRKGNPFDTNTNTDAIIDGSVVRVDMNTREVFVDTYPIIGLTPKEFDLLAFFVQYPKQVFTRDQILQQVWGFQFYGEDRTVDVHIKRLRRKIARENQPFLHTVWGVGYKFDETVVVNED